MNAPIPSDEHSNGNASLAGPWIDEFGETDKVLSGAFLIGIITLSFVGNTLVIAAVIYSGKLRDQISTIYIINLSITDILNAILVMPFAVAALLENGWEFGTFMCNVQCALNYCCIIVSMLTLALIAIDRYLMTCKSSFYTNKVTRRVAATLTIYSWLQGILFAVIPVCLSWIIYDKWEVVCAIDWNYGGHGPVIYVLFAFTLCFAIPVIVIFVSYVKVYRMIRNPVSRVSVVSTFERKILVSIVVIVAIFLVCMTPFCMTKVIKIFINKYSMPGRVNTFATLMQFLASGTNPLVYGVFRRDFRVVYKRMICFKRYVKVGPVNSCVFSLSRCETNVDELVMSSLPEAEKDKGNELELTDYDDGDHDIFHR
ncbi:D(1A) dopamine receptor-like [Glandiceps talaboti]